MEVDTMRKAVKILAVVFVWVAITINISVAQKNNGNIKLDEWQIEYFVKKNLRDFPQSTLQDLYKSFFQSVFGPEHLVSDKEKVMSFIDWELTQEFNYVYPIYESVGVSGDFVRVNLSNVLNGYITKERLADCFIRSSKVEHKHTLEEFYAMWVQVTNWIEKNNVTLDNYDKDKKFIDELIAKGEYAWVHSNGYRSYYKPHYRIVEKEIFFKEIYPFITDRKD